MKTNKELLLEFLDGLNIDNLTPSDFFDGYNVDGNTTFEGVTELLEHKDAFVVEIIYYSTAMEFLSENDNSLMESLGIAAEYGLELSNLNSEALASLLASSYLRNAWNDKESEITEFLDGLDWN